MEKKIVSQSINKEAVLDFFLENYGNFTWTREDKGDLDLITEVGKYKYRLAATREGTFLQAIRTGECIGPTIDSKEFPNVKTLRDKVWDFINGIEEDNKWKNILNDLKCYVHYQREDCR